MKNLFEIIDDMEVYVYDYDLNAFQGGINQILDTIAPLLETLEERKVVSLSEILGYVNTALSNKDYVLCFDLLKHELRPFLEMNIVRGEGELK